MPRYLWVEDFDNTSCRDTTFLVFGEIAGKQDEIPDDKEDLREYLAEKDILLETTLSTALRFIEQTENLESIDFVILDIDLRISEEKEDEDNNRMLHDIFESHGTSSDDNPTRIEIKKIAGYHLWTRLVIDMGFPRNRIQFCSNHGDFLDSIKASFIQARIVPPAIFTKTDGKMVSWIMLQNMDDYISFRRNVIDYCRIIFDHLNESDLSQDLICLHRLPGKNTSDFTIEHAYEMLEALPKYLPVNVSENHRAEVLRSFLRRLTVEWDRFSATKEHIQKLNENQRRIYENINQQTKTSASVLKLIRNTLSHSSGKPVHVTCDLAALYFILNMRTIFQIEDSKSLELLEDKIFPQLEINKGLICKVFNKLKFMKNSVEQLSKHYNINSKLSQENRYFISELLRLLQENDIKEYQEKSLVYGILFIWSELSNKPLNKLSATEFESFLQKKLSSKIIIDRLAVAYLNCILK